MCTKEKKINIIEEESLNKIDYLKEKLKEVHTAYAAREYLEDLVNHILECDLNCFFSFSMARDVLSLVSKNYERYNRIAYAIRVDRLLIDNDLKLLAKDKDMLDKFDIANIKDDIKMAIEHRNIYNKDYCKDITEKFKAYDDLFSLQELIDENVESRSLFEYDPVELTEEYLAVIDEVEKIINESNIPFGLGSCHIIWGIKKRELSKRGIEWRSPAEMNPYIMFD